jgi:2'-5' RNA ligase
MILLLGINISNFLVCDEKADLFIAISFKGASFDSLRKQLGQDQAKISKASSYKGYQFDQIIEPKDLHVTIETIRDIDIADIPKYKKCIHQVASNIEAFDAAPYIQKSVFDIWNHGRTWGILRFETPSKSGFSRLARQVRHCLKQTGLQVGIYDDYSAHISLGIFTDKQYPLPSNKNLSWVPDVSIDLNNETAVVAQIYLRIRKHVENKKTGIKSLKNSYHYYNLKKSSKIKHKDASEEKSWCAIM